MKRFAGQCAKYRQILVAGVIAVLLVLADYFSSNMSFPLLDSSDSLAPYAYLLEKDEEDGDDVLCANVALDKELVTVRDEFGDSAGQAVITDRAALTRFLEIVDSSRYRYIFIDIRFEQGFETPHDSALFARIKSMPRVVFSTHRGLENDITDPRLAAKAAYADYRHKRQSGFSRYEFLQDGHESVALRMYRELDGGEIHPAGMGHADHGRLCHNMLFVPIPVSATEQYGPDGEVRFPYMGTQLLGKYTPGELRKLVDGKIVLIGDFDNDLHGTFTGDVPGPLLSYYAYRALARGDHKVSFWLYLFLTVLYFGITLTLLGKMPLKIHVKRPFLVLLLSFVSWGLILWALKVGLFLFFSLDFCATLPAAVFSLISFFRKIKTSQS
ncbi:MAG: hypothetical protein ACI30N_00450 [Muribaculaceae bacterium]